MILWFIIIIIIAAVIIYFLISQSKQGPRENNTNYYKPVTILKERYARGEITLEELSKCWKILKIEPGFKSKNIFYFCKGMQYGEADF